MNEQTLAFKLAHCRIVAAIPNQKLLNDWEKGFLESISTALFQYGSLSAKQTGVLNKCWTKAETVALDAEQLQHRAELLDLLSDKENEHVGSSSK